MTTFVQLFRNSFNAILGFIYPEICQICETWRATPRESFVCSNCRSQVHFIRPPFCKRCGLPYPGDFSTSFECTNCREMDLRFVSARSAVVAHGIVRKAVHHYKYNRAVWFESFLAELLIHEAKPALLQGRWDCIVPVPLHPLKRRQREFNQAERLASHLSTATRIPLNRHLLRRIKSTNTQTLLTRQQRMANMRGAFAACRGRQLDGERVVLVDDVFTTGATASACAQALQTAGAGDVCVWTVARGL